MTCPECGADLHGRGTLVPGAPRRSRRAPSTLRRLVAWTALLIVYCPLGLFVTAPFAPCWVEVRIAGGPDPYRPYFSVPTYSIEIETDYTGLHPLPLSPRCTYVEVRTAPSRRRRMLIHPATSGYEYLDSSNHYVVRPDGLDRSVLLDLFACVGIDTTTPAAASAADSLLQDVRSWRSANYLTLQGSGKTYPDLLTSFILLWVVAWLAGVATYLWRAARAARRTTPKNELVLG